MLEEHILRTNAIVLKSKDYLETSLLVTLFSEDFGKIDAIAKGYRKPKSQFGNSLDLFTIAEIVIYNKPNRELQIISQAEIIQKFDFNANMAHFAYASGMIELFDKLVLTQDTTSKEANTPLFSLLKNFISITEKSKENQLKILFLAYEMRLATLLGYMPNFDSCIICGSSIDNSIFYFDTMEGGLVHKKCKSHRQTENLISIDKGIIKVFEKLINGNLELIQKLKLTTDNEKKIENAIDRFFKNNITGYAPLKSLKFLQKIDEVN